MLLESFNVWIRQHANGRPYFAFPADDALKGLEAKDHYISNGMSAKFYHDVGWFSPVVRTQLLSNSSLSAADFETMAVNCRAFLGQHLEVNPGTLIPDDVLTGPFFFVSDDESEQDGAGSDGGGGAFELYEEKYERLFWLVRGGACLQEEQTWEVSREGFRAILELIKAAAQRGEASATQVAWLPEALVQVLEVAAGLFVLFDVLGVFSVQWPKCKSPTSPNVTAFHILYVAETQPWSSTSIGLTCHQQISSKQVSQKSSNSSRPSLQDPPQRPSSGTWPPPSGTLCEPRAQRPSTN